MVGHCGRVEGYDEALQHEENQDSAEEVPDRSLSSLFNALFEEPSHWPLLLSWGSRLWAVVIIG